MIVMHLNCYYGYKTGIRIILTRLSQTCLHFAVYQVYNVIFTLFISYSGLRSTDSHAVIAVGGTFLLPSNVCSLKVINCNQCYVLLMS